MKRLTMSLTAVLALTFSLHSSAGVLLAQSRGKAPAARPAVAQRPAPRPALAQQKPSPGNNRAATATLTKGPKVGSSGGNGGRARVANARGGHGGDGSGA